MSWYQINIDLFCLKETWLSHDDYVSLNESTPPSHTSTHIPRDTGRGGGAAAIHNSSLTINPKPKLNYKSFESLILSLSYPAGKTVQPILFVIVYHPPGPYFLCEFSEFLSGSVLKTDKIVIVGDFNIHVNIQDDSLGSAFISPTFFVSAYKSPLTAFIIFLTLYWHMGWKLIT